jgi:hypothetical protein
MLDKGIVIIDEKLKIEYRDKNSLSHGENKKRCLLSYSVKARRTTES